MASEYLMASLLHIEHLGQFQEGFFIDFFQDIHYLAVVYAERAALLADNKYLKVRANLLRSIAMR